MERSRRQNLQLINICRDKESINKEGSQQQEARDKSLRFSNDRHRSQRIEWNQ